MEDRESIEQVAEDTEDEVDAHKKHPRGVGAVEDPDSADDDFEAHRKHGGVN